MIHMLSRFNLKENADPEAFAQGYARLAAEMRAAGMAEATGPVGRRVGDTPMDTDADDAPEYYAIMTFRDRAQLDAAYAHLLSAGGAAPTSGAHNTVTAMICDPVFTCSSLWKVVGR